MPSFWLLCSPFPSFWCFLNIYNLLSPREDGKLITLLFFCVSSINLMFISLRRQAIFSWRKWKLIDKLWVLWGVESTRCWKKAQFPYNFNTFLWIVHFHSAYKLIARTSWYVFFIANISTLHISRTWHFIVENYNYKCMHCLFVVFLFGGIR